MRQRLIAMLMLTIGTLILSVTLIGAQTRVRAVVINEFSNIRLSPAIGATVIDTVSAGYVYETITARDATRQWLRVDYNGSQGWVNVVPLLILDGDVDSLPVADPRTIPYGGFDAPRAGFSEVQGAVAGAATAGLRVRAGPSTAYPTLANINFNQQFTITGVYGGGTWYQVNFQNTLGWVSANFVRSLSGGIAQVPVDGIVAQQAPPSEDSFQDYVGLLQFMLDRLNIAQESLNQIRALWTDAAVNGRATCQGYPPQPTPISIPVPVLAANFNTLDPLQRDFDDAMANVRRAIELFIEVCNQPGTGNPVGQATASGALGVVALADQQFASLRQRLEALIPDLDLGEGECLLTFNNRAEVLPVIQIGLVYQDDLTQRARARGYCFYGISGQVLSLQLLPLPPSELSLFATVSQLDNPTNFINLGQSLPGFPLTIGPITLPETDTYVVLISDLGTSGDTGEFGQRDRQELQDAAANIQRSTTGDFAFRLADRNFDNRELVFDEATQSVVLRQPGEGGGGDQLPDIDDSPVVCPSLQFTCTSGLFTCAEAQACYAAGNLSLDGDGDGIPCNEGANNLCTGQ